MKSSSRQTGSSVVPLPPSHRDLVESLSSTMCEHLKIREEQAHSLLTDGRPYLKFLLVNGIKDSYDPLVRWMQSVFASVPELVAIIVSTTVLPFTPPCGGG
jgi:hypothetical protein